MRKILCFVLGLVLTAAGLSRAEDATLPAPTNLDAGDLVIGTGNNFNSQSHIQFVWESDQSRFEIEVYSQYGERVLHLFYGATNYLWYFAEDGDVTPATIRDWGTLTCKVRCAVDGAYSPWAEVNFVLDASASGGLVTPENLSVKKDYNTSGEDPNVPPTEIRIFSWTRPRTAQKCQIEIYSGESIEHGTLIKTAWGQNGSGEWFCEDERAAKGTYC